MSNSSTPSAPRSIDRARTRRLVIIAIITIIVELALYILTWRGPALVHLIRPVYLIVLVVAAITAWHAARRRPGQDRRRTDRRHGRD